MKVNILKNNFPMGHVSESECDMANVGHYGPIIWPIETSKEGDLVKTSWKRRSRPKPIGSGRCWESL